MYVNQFNFILLAFLTISNQNLLHCLCKVSLKGAPPPSLFDSQTNRLSNLLFTKSLTLPAGCHVIDSIL